MQKKKKQHGIDQATMEKNELLPVQAGRVWPELAKSCGGDHKKMAHKKRQRQKRAR